MLDDLPDLDNFFENELSSNNNKSEKSVVKNGAVGVFISKESGKWIPAYFIDIAVGAIGLHIQLPVALELTPKELKDLKIKFVQYDNDKENLLKEAPVNVRWQEADNLIGTLKLGLHFNSDYNEDEDLKNILRLLKENSQ